MGRARCAARVCVRACVRLRGRLWPLRPPTHRQIEFVCVVAHGSEAEVIVHRRMHVPGEGNKVGNEVAGSERKEGRGTRDEGRGT